MIVNGAARMLLGARLPSRAPKSSVADPFMTVAMEPDAVEQGFDVLGHHRADRRRR